MSKVWHELLGIFILWLLWLIGAAIATVSTLPLPSLSPHMLTLTYA